MEAPILQLAEAPTAVPMLALLADLASVVIAAAMLILVLGAALLFARLNRAIDDLRTLARDNLRPVSDRARIISDNVEFITASTTADGEWVLDINYDAAVNKELKNDETFIFDLKVVQD